MISNKLRKRIAILKEKEVTTDKSSSTKNKSLKSVKYTKKDKTDKTKIKK